MNPVFFEFMKQNTMAELVLLRRDLKFSGLWFQVSDQGIHTFFVISSGNKFSLFISMMNKLITRIFVIILLFYHFTGCNQHLSGQSVKNTGSDSLWHGIVRTLRYHPDGEDFVIVNGEKRFNRALYGTNTGFRIETGDLPEFALYMPGMGGNLKFGLIKEDTAKWLINADTIIARYRPGSMLYEIKDALLENCIINLSVNAMADAEGLILKFTIIDNPGNCQLFWVYGGATGKKFSRNGDIGADPESVFYLKPEYCTDNEFYTKGNQFRLYYGSGRIQSDNELYENNYQLTDQEKEALRFKNKKRIAGMVPPESSVKICDANMQDSPTTLLKSSVSDTPVIAGLLKIAAQKDYYYILYNPETRDTIIYNKVPLLFQEAELSRKRLADRIKINSPDPYINALGGALAVAADAIWEPPSYLHGAIAWRMRLPGWRGAYVADWLGWHDRARTHFNAYLKAQYTSPDSGPSVPDPKTHLARQEEKTGTAIFTSGYISRYPERISKPHHYDMNLVFFDQLLWHIKWTGDTTYARSVWPALKRHLAWEKRCFDGNNDGLYDAYCCIWASDALEYSGGGVTHSSAYNYRGNKIAAEIAEIIGEDPEPFKREAEKIKHALNSVLWLPDRGWYAEYKDLLGAKSVHPSAALWTIYHAIDADVPDDFQSYQCLKYIDAHIPHIPVKAENMPEEDCYVLSTTNWMPYAWSINNVALAENLNTALAFWQGGRETEAFRLWKSSLLESMFMGSSPGNFEQLSLYDAFRGELYRDFADPIGVAARTLVEGLFGIKPDALHDTLVINPGIPDTWEYASLQTPDISFDFSKEGETDNYVIKPAFPVGLFLIMRLKARSDKVESIKINGEYAAWKIVRDAVGYPQIEIMAGFAEEYQISITWKGELPAKIPCSDIYANTDRIFLKSDAADILKIYDPQGSLKEIHTGRHELTSEFRKVTGYKTFFILLSQDKFNWWQPVSFELKEPVEIISSGHQEKDLLNFRLKNNTNKEIAVVFDVNPPIFNYGGEKVIPAHSCSSPLMVPAEFIISGSNVVRVSVDGVVYKKLLINWKTDSIQLLTYRTVDLSAYFNDKVSGIFKNRYLSPRSPFPTLQMPWQGIGDWCSYNETALVNDSGLRSIAGEKGKVIIPQSIPFQTQGLNDKPDIVFTSQWDNYPDRIKIPLNGRACHAYLLMAGSTGHMQSRFINGRITIRYFDGTEDSLELINPLNWWPVEQDYYIDGYAFSIDAPAPLRIDLKTGADRLSSYPVLLNNKTAYIDGGSATVLDIPLDPLKDLQELRLEASANEVIIGLMSVTLATKK